MNENNNILIEVKGSKNTVQSITHDLVKFFGVAVVFPVRKVRNKEDYRARLIIYDYTGSDSALDRTSADAEAPESQIRLEGF